MRRVAACSKQAAHSSADVAHFSLMLAFRRYGKDQPPRKGINPWNRRKNPGHRAGQAPAARNVPAAQAESRAAGLRTEERAHLLAGSGTHPLQIAPIAQTAPKRST